MSGLIWAGIGQGIANAGQSFANAGMKQIEMDRQDERDALREERLLKRQEALDQIKADREETKAEELQLRTIKESSQVRTTADTIGATRSSKAFDSLTQSSAAAGEDGDIPLSKEQLQKVVKDNPALGEQYKKMGLIESAMPLTENQKRMQRADDEVQAGLDIGAHSTVQKALLEKRKSVLEDIREDNKDAKTKAEQDGNNRRMDQNDRRLDILDKNSATQARNADTSAARVSAAVERAGQPKPDPQSTPSARLNSVSTAITDIRKSLDAGGYTKEEEVKAMEDLKTLQAARTSLAKQVAGNKADEVSTSTSPSKPASGSLPPGAVYLGKSGGRPVYQDPKTGKKFVAD